MLQATICDDVALDTLTFCEDRLGPAEVNVSRGQIIEALVIAGIIFDEGGDLPLAIARQVIVVGSRIP